MASYSTCFDYSPLFSENVFISLNSTYSELVQDSYGLCLLSLVFKEMEYHLTAVWLLGYESDLGASWKVALCLCPSGPHCCCCSQSCWSEFAVIWPFHWLIGGEKRYWPHFLVCFLSNLTACWDIVEWGYKSNLKQPLCESTNLPPQYEALDFKGEVNIHKSRTKRRAGLSGDVIEKWAILVAVFHHP